MTTLPTLPTLCTDDVRRITVRADRLNGIDGVDISADQRTITLGLFADAPAGLVPANILLGGGERIPAASIKVLTVTPGPESTLAVTVDRPGDFSTYTVTVVGPGPDGKPGTAPFSGFDVRYATAQFSFKQDCPVDLDCADGGNCAGCAGCAGAGPQAGSAGSAAAPGDLNLNLNYLAKDYAGFRQLLLDRLAATMPDWTETHVPDLGITLVELLAYLGDQLSYFQDAIATEAYLDTARQRISVRRHARLVDYAMHEGCNARAWVHVATSADTAFNLADVRFLTLPPTVLPGRTVLSAADAAGLAPGVAGVFEPLDHGTINLHAAHNEIELWNWGDSVCSIPSGAICATLRDDFAVHGGPARMLQLAPGDLLAFEEIAGPVTGAAADADPAHRHIVRITSVQPDLDPLFNQPILNVGWQIEDALPFALCVSSHAAPKAAVARGNIVLVDHGASITWHGAAPEQLDPASGGLLFGPALASAPVTRSAPYPDPAGVARMQAIVLATIPDDTRSRISALLTAVIGGTALTTTQLSDLKPLFGQRTLDTVGMVTDQAAGLRALLARFDEFLADKLRRLTTLGSRARAGMVLGGDIDWELSQTWYSGYATLLDPDQPSLRGPAVAVLQDPAAALPRLALTDRDNPARRWLPVSDLVGERASVVPPGATGADPAGVVVEVDDDGAARLRFGLAAPEPGSVLLADYRVGNGAAGNVGAEAISRVVYATTVLNTVTAVRNPLPAFGGVDPETIDAVRDAAPTAYQRQQLRAVTADDYAAFANQVPGVQRAAAALRWNGSWYEAHVYIDAAGAGDAPAALLQAVGDWLHPYRRIGHDVYVHPAIQVPLDIAFEVCVDSTKLTGQVRPALLAALAAYFAPDRLTFGTAIRASDLISVVTKVPGVRAARLTRLQRLFVPDSGALATGALTLGSMEVPQLSVDGTGEHGRIELDLEGGR